jgi:hypothetical protein
MRSRDVWAKEKKVSLQSGSSSERRAEGPGWRLGFRPNDERLYLDETCRSSVPERNRSFTWSWGGWYIVRRRRRTSGRRFSVGSLRGKGGSGRTERGRRPGSFRWRNELPRGVPWVGTNLEVSWTRVLEEKSLRSLRESSISKTCVGGLCHMCKLRPKAKVATAGEKWVVSVVYFKLGAPINCKHMALKNHM